MDSDEEDLSFDPKQKKPNSNLNFVWQNSAPACYQIVFIFVMLSLVRLGLQHNRIPPNLGVSLYCLCVVDSPSEKSNVNVKNRTLLMNKKKLSICSK